jgi:multiple sugar transport system permease protein
VLENEVSLGYLLLIPLLVVVLGLIGYPFILSLYFSLTSKVLGQDELTFVGLKNYINLVKDPIFRRTIKNTFHYSVTAVFFKLSLGLLMALTLNEVRRGRRFFRAAYLLPWVAPSSLTVLAWLWMFDSQFSIITYFLRNVGLIEAKIPWFGRPALAMAAVQTVNIWRGTPFFAMIILAGLVTVSEELYDAATVDGANAWQRFWNITFPHILPILMVATLFSFVRTLGDFHPPGGHAGLHQGDSRGRPGQGYGHCRVLVPLPGDHYRPAIALPASGVVSYDGRHSNTSRL